MQKPEHFARVTSSFTKVIVLNLANFTPPSTLSNLHAAFFYSKEMNYHDRMLGHVKSFCGDYQAKKLTGASDLERYPNIDDEAINELCCLFNFLKKMLMNSKETFINQYYRSGRGKIPANFYTLISYFNRITEALLRFLWLRILFGEGNFNFMVINHFTAAVLFKDRYFLNNEKSRLTTRFLNCAS